MLFEYHCSELKNRSNSFYEHEFDKKYTKNDR